jgi:hypothetical protein
MAERPFRQRVAAVAVFAVTAVITVGVVVIFWTGLICIANKWGAM